MSKGRRGRTMEKSKDKPIAKDNSHRNMMITYAVFFVIGCIGFGVSAEILGFTGLLDGYMGAVFVVSLISLSLTMIYVEKEIDKNKAKKELDELVKTLLRVDKYFILSKGKTENPKVTMYLIQVGQEFYSINMKTEEVIKFSQGEVLNKK